MKVIGTAGHIDHGKSTLVYRLTGIDPDRLAEEKQRGMTIDLGFAWLTLPSGTDVSIVDVPGHERFVKNMLAGAGGVDLALLVVAADEGPMPQTREHLDILDLLAVERGVVALTKSDLVDDDWLALVREEVDELLAGTALAGSSIVPVSSTTGAGIDLLLTALDDAVGNGLDRADLGKPYLPVDRVFTISGFGTVVTGTLNDGSLTVGDEIEIVPGGKRARIRGIQSHRAAAHSVAPGARAAINLSGVSRHDIERGDIIARPETLQGLDRFDAHIRVVRSAPFPLQHGVEATIHVGSAERAASIAVLGGEEVAPGDDGWIQVRMSEPVAAVRGQRFIIRLPAPGRTIAGGEIVDIAPVHRRFDSSAVVRLQRLADIRPSERLAAALGGRGTRTMDELLRIAGVPENEALEAVQTLEASGEIVRLGDSFASRQAWERLESTGSAALLKYHREYPLRRGMASEELRRRLHRDPSVWNAVRARLVSTGVVRDHAGYIALPDHGGGVQSRRKDADRVLEALRSNPYTPPSGGELLASTGADRELLEALVDERLIVRIHDGLYFEREAYDRIVNDIVSRIRAGGEVSVGSLRDTFNTSRKYALALLEHLDGERITRRVGDTRALGAKAPTCA